MGISGAAVVLMGLLLLAMVVLVAYLALRKSPVPDLLPQLQRRLPWQETLLQVAWIGAGLGMVLLAKLLQHSH